MQPSEGIDDEDVGNDEDDDADDFDLESGVRLCLHDLQSQG